MTISDFPPLLSHEEMKKHKIPLAYRDRCAGLLVPLNKCRKEGWYMPWNCVNERHDYEQCQYLDFKRRVKELEEIKAQRDEQAKLSRQQVLSSFGGDDDDDDE